MFAHEKLHVYGKALDFTHSMATLSAGWDKRHAVVDQLARATESIIMNLADAARFQPVPTRSKTSDFAIGSSLECAGCLDIAQRRRLLRPNAYQNEKVRLCEITKMLIGLRKSWRTGTIREEPHSSYGSTPGSRSAPQLFHHESLDVYQCGLGFIEWLDACLNHQC